MEDLSLSDITKKDPKLDETLRPASLGQFIGQETIKNNLKIALDAALKRKEPVGHILFHGSPGLGKTTLAKIISGEMGSQLTITSGPAIERTGDLASLLSNIEEGDVLFIDEIHRLPRQIEEMLYSAMEDFALDVMLGKGLATKSMRLQLPRFTLIGATTKAGSISSPLRDRFSHVYHLTFYSPEDIAKIIGRSSNILKIPIEPKAIDIISTRSRRTPRIANRLLERVRDFSEVKDSKIISADHASQALKLLDIDSLGLEKGDRQLLITITKSFDGGPVGLSTLSAALATEKETIEDVIEPFLIQLGLIKRTAKGRVVTANGLNHIEQFS